MFTIMCPKEQQTSHNLIVKDNCFTIEIFDKFSFSGILRGCLSHLNQESHWESLEVIGSHWKSLGVIA